MRARVVEDAMVFSVWDEGSKACDREYPYLGNGRRRCTFITYIYRQFPAPDVIRCYAVLCKHGDYGPHASL